MKTLNKIMEAALYVLCICAVGLFGAMLLAGLFGFMDAPLPL